MKELKIKLLAIVTTALLLTFSLSNAQTVASTETETNSQPAIGTIVLLKGVVTARSESRPLTALAKGSTIYLKDKIETASRSFVVMRMNDGGKITLRPNSEFNLNDYDDTEGQEKSFFQLVKGGIRSLTGRIGKARPQNVRYQVRTTTIGIRGTEFIAVDCASDPEACKFEDEDGGEEAEEELFAVTSDGVTRKIDMKKMPSILNGIFLAVAAGKITIEEGVWSFEMGTGQRCEVGLGDPTCFIGLQELLDPYLGGDAEELSMFNLFGNEDDVGGAELCEIQ